MIPHVTGDDEWLYPAAGDPEPPVGTKIFILTHGDVAIVGVWRVEMRDKGWRPLFRRNMEKEDAINQGVND